MSERYQITLDSPMGPRTGTLKLERTENGSVTGVLSLLGFENLVSGREIGPSTVQFTHSLRSLVSELACRSVVEFGEDGLTGTVHTDRGEMSLRGVRMSALANAPVKK